MEASAGDQQMKMDIEETTPTNKRKHDHPSHYENKDTNLEQSRDVIPKQSQRRTKSLFRCIQAQQYPHKSSRTAHIYDMYGKCTSRRLLSLLH